MQTTTTTNRASELVPLVERLVAECFAIERRHERALEEVPASHRASARNLLHYVALRQHDLRELQPRLASLGLSSLGRSEAHVLQTLAAVLAALRALAGLPGEPERAEESSLSGTHRLREHATELLGAPQPGRNGRIMVTMPTEAATRYELVRDLVARGMDVMRVNLAHDGPAQWRAMAENLRRARAELGRDCKLMCDLAGPKLRTGALEPGVPLLHVKPLPDERGLPVVPRRVRLHGSRGPDGAALPPECAALPLSDELLAALHEGDRLEIADARGRTRVLTVLALDEGGAWAELDRGLWVTSGAEAVAHRGGEPLAHGRVGALPECAAPIVLVPGDELLLSFDPQPGRGRRAELRARIPCTLPEALRAVRPGERVLFDDGKIKTEVLRRDSDGLLLRVTHASTVPARLSAGKGINLPDSEVELPDLTDMDLADLDFVVEHADLVGMSFVRGPGSIRTLQRELERRSPCPPAIVAKIETRRAFDALPHILLAGSRRPPFGVLIARGDLAVEVGFQRLAEVQEEILWMCEAAHVPTIWATQVLDMLARTGSPTRAEVSDAVLSARAECVMLNKGPYILEALAFLEDVQLRMHAHAEKKTSLLRSLGLTRKL